MSTTATVGADKPPEGLLDGPAEMAARPKKVLSPEQVARLTNDKAMSDLYARVEVGMPILFWRDGDVTGLPAAATVVEIGTRNLRLVPMDRTGFRPPPDGVKHKDDFQLNLLDGDTRSKVGCWDFAPWMKRFLKMQS